MDVGAKGKSSELSPECLCRASIIRMITELWNSPKEDGWTKKCKLLISQMTSAYWLALVLVQTTNLTLQWKRVWEMPAVPTSEHTAMWTWARFLTSLRFTVVLCKMRSCRNTMTETSTSQLCCCSWGQGISTCSVTLNLGSAMRSCHFRSFLTSPGLPSSIASCVKEVGWIWWSVKTSGIR